MFSIQKTEGRSSTSYDLRGYYLVSTLFLVLLTQFVKILYYNITLFLCS